MHRSYRFEIIEKKGHDCKDDDDNLHFQLILMKKMKKEMKRVKKILKKETKPMKMTMKDMKIHQKVMKLRKETKSVKKIMKDTKIHRKQTMKKKLTRMLGHHTAVLGQLQTEGIKLVRKMTR